MKRPREAAVTVLVAAGGWLDVPAAWPADGATRVVRMRGGRELSASGAPPEGADVLVAGAGGEAECAWRLLGWRLRLKKETRALDAPGGALPGRMADGD